MKAALGRSSWRVSCTRSAAGATGPSWPSTAPPSWRRCSRRSSSASRSGRRRACAGRRGKFEHADGGTLFLDEVSDLSLSAQAKLLRALQDLSIERVGATGAKRVNTRIVVATNRPLADLVSRSQFRADLYYRLSGVEIHVPPLRQRREDILELARYFLTRHRGARELTLSVAAEDALRLYGWPGNVRELERLMERAVALDGLRPCRAERSAAARARRLWDGHRSLARRGRLAPGVGQSLCEPRLRTLRPQQAADLSRPRHQLSHAAGVSAVRRSQDPDVRYAAAGMGHVDEYVADRARRGGVSGGSVVVRRTLFSVWCRPCRG